MELLTNYSTREYNFTLWFFRILLAMTVAMLFMLFTLRINETVSIKEGEIVAANPQSDFKAPFEAQIVKVFVKEGQPVKKGDTMMTLLTVDFEEQRAKTKTEINYLQKKIQSITVLENAIEQKKGAIEQTGDITAKKYQLDINRLVSDMQSLDEQYSLQKEKLTSTAEKMSGDSILYKKDMLSKYELNNAKDAHLNVKENLNAVETQRIRQQSEEKLAYNNFTKEQNTLLLNKVQLEENAQALLQAKIENQNQLLQAKESLKKLETELGKQSVVAVSNGIVNFIFNTKQSSNLLSKGDLLISIAPDGLSYYARINLPEKDMPYIRAGLIARLKLSAYQTFQYGLITGKVSYVAERKEKEKFYALVELEDNPRFHLKSGYEVHGEIVIDRMPLYRYFVKKLFKQIDQG